MRQKYLIRLDDACPTMDASKWGRMENLLDNYGVKPMVGVIPYNEDPQQFIDSEDNGFWNKVHKWGEKGWSIALHGYNHCYSSDGGMKGINPMWSRSEFAGLSLEEQREKIREGVAIMKDAGVEPKYFFAPSHTFDYNTLAALKEESAIRIISDTIGRYPYKKDGFLFIPQIAGHCVKMPVNGIYTFCFHPNTMSDVAFDNLEQFLNKYRDWFISFQNLQIEQYGKKSIVDRLISWSFFTYRKIKGLK